MSSADYLNLFDGGHNAAIFGLQCHIDLRLKIAKSL
jgi:hypothetical protein